MDRETIKRQFGAYAADYVTSSTHAHGRSLARLVEVVPVQPDWHALDVATGAGHTAFAFAPHISRIWATDITEQMLAATRQGAARRDLGNVIVAYADAEELPFDDGRFDLVTCRIAAHHFGDIQPFMREATRVLRPGGYLAVVDNVVPAGPAGDTINTLEKMRDPSHGRCLSFAEWVSAFSTRKLKVHHAEMLDKTVQFDVWAVRHDEARQTALRAMLSEAAGDAAAFLRPHTLGDMFLFHLCEGLVIGQVAE